MTDLVNKQQFNPVSADKQSDKLIKLQLELDKIQQSISPEKLRAALFNKMLDMYQVPMSHALRHSTVPDRLDDPSIELKLNQHGFFNQNKPVIH